MKKLNLWQNIVFQVGGLMMVAGAAMPLFTSHRAWAFLLQLGTLMFGSMQMLQRYEGSDAVMQRLRRQQLLGAFLLILSGALALMHVLGIGYIGSGEWKLCFAIAAVMEGYTAFRMKED